MALTRKLLRGMGLTEEQADTVIEAHTETVEGLKERITAYEGDARELENVKRELEELRTGGGEWQKRFEEEHALFEGYKQEQSQKELRAKKAEAYGALLRETGISERRIGAILRLTDVDSLELDESGRLTDAETKAEEIRREYSDFIVTSTERGADVPTPPTNNPSERDPFLEGFDA